MLNYNVLAFRIRKQNQNISFRSKVILILVQVIIFEKIHVEDARNHAHHRRRGTARLTTNEAALESA